MSVEPKKLYNPVTSLLLGDKTAWQGMRLTGQIRRDEGVRTPTDLDSAYRPIVRTERRFNTLKVPRKLEASLPYASKTKHLAPQRKKTYLQARAVVLDPEEKKAVTLLQQIQTLKKDKVARRQAKKEEGREAFRKKMEGVDERKGEKMKEERRERFRKEGMKRKRDEAAAESRGGKRRA